MKKILSVIIILSVFLTSCLKDDTINTEGGLISTPTAVQITYSGLAYFGDATQFTAGETEPMDVELVINLAGRQTLSSDLTVTLDVDDALRVAYNADPAHKVKYVPLPDSCFSFDDKVAVIPAGKYLDTVVFTLFPAKMDPLKNYMAAITIKDASGQVIAANFATYYLHTIGNPIAGGYTRNWIRYNTLTQTGSPSNTSTVASAFSPIDSATVSAPSGTGPKYIVSFVKTGNVYSDWKVALDPQSVTDAGITIDSGPFIIKADPATKSYEFNYTYINSAGAGRNITDKFHNP